jgi:hypothetical protein
MILRGSDYLRLYIQLEYQLDTSYRHLGNYFRGCGLVLHQEISSIPRPGSELASKSEINAHHRTDARPSDFYRLAASSP